MFYLACTRFNTATYAENIDYRKKHGETVIYGSAFKIRDIYSPGSLLFVAEMDNETNKIEGIGLIRNTIVSNKRHKIHASNNEYNRFIYKGSYWISRDQIHNYNSEINEIFDTILFKGKSNLKRMAGITVLTERLFTNWDYELPALKTAVKNAFVHYCKNTDDFEEEEIMIEINPTKRKGKKDK